MSLSSFFSSSWICFDSASIFFILGLEEGFISFSFISRGKSFWRGLIRTVGFLFRTATFTSAPLIIPSLPAMSFSILPNCYFSSSDFHQVRLLCHSLWYCFLWFCFRRVSIWALVDSLFSNASKRIGVLVPTGAFLKVLVHGCSWNQDHSHTLLLR